MLIAETAQSTISESAGASSWGSHDVGERDLGSKIENRVAAASEQTLAGDGLVQGDLVGDSAPTEAAAPGALADLIELSKPRIVTMILVTTVATALIGAGGGVGWFSLLWLLLGTAGIAGSAGASNQIWERVIDREMTRTATRPISSGRMSVSVGVAFALITGVGGTALLATGFGAAPAWVGVLTWVIYVMVYTPMKTRTYWNTTVGAVAGALPVLIGYTATGGHWADLTAWMLFGVLAGWQYPHFMAIAWLYRKQYGDAGFEMTTTVEPTGRSAAHQSIAGSLAILACGAVLCLSFGANATGVIATTMVALFTWPLLKASLRFWREPSDITSRKMLRASLLVLPMVLLVVTARILL
ncbi:MAG: protoheme IX farnesyltransferase [Planctomycetota bacterium]